MHGYEILLWSSAIRTYILVLHSYFINTIYLNYDHSSIHEYPIGRVNDYHLLNRWMCLRSRGSLNSRRLNKRRALICVCAIIVHSILE